MGTASKAVVPKTFQPHKSTNFFRDKQPFSLPFLPWFICPYHLPCAGSEDLCSDLDQVINLAEN